MAWGLPSGGSQATQTAYNAENIQKGMIDKYGTYSRR